MKYIKKRKRYEGCNKGNRVFFNPEICQAHSYGWWRFVDKVNGKVIFNDYNYSPTTSKHQSKVRRLMRDLGIKIDLFIEAPDGLNCHTNHIIRYYENKILTLREQINAPRSWKKTNEKRELRIVEHKKTIKQICEVYNINSPKYSELGLLLRGVA